MSNQSTESTEDSSIMPVWRILSNQFALYALAMAMPIYDVLSNYPEFFVANQLHRTEIYFLVAVLSLVIPLASTLIALAIRRWTLAPHLITLFGLATLNLLLISKGIGLSYTPVALGSSILLAGVFTYHYANHRVFSFVIALLMPIAIIIPWQFLNHSDIALLIRGSGGSSATEDERAPTTIENTPPIIMVIFDELPIVDLLDVEGNIDGKNFPNFAAFASRATWYENATTVATETMVAVPAILDGRWPGQSRLGIYSVHPQNLFALLQDRYTLNLFESITKLAPPSYDYETRKGSIPDRLRRLRRTAEDVAVVYLSLILPDDYAQRLPGIDSQWGGFLDASEKDTKIDATFGEDLPDTTKPVTPMEEIQAVLAEDRAAYFMEFVNSLKGHPKNSIHFIHTLLPHRPHSYLPSGRFYSKRGAPSGISTNKKTQGLQGDQVLIDRYHQGHRLQIGFVDSLLGELLLEVQRIGIYDESLIIICADHGISFQEEQPVRRPTLENLGELAYVPLLLKYPNQTRGVRDDRNVQTIDILPTIRDVLGVQVDWEEDGRSLLDTTTPPLDVVKMFHHSLDKPMLLDPKYCLELRQQAHQRIVEIYKLDDPKSNLFSYSNALHSIGQLRASLRAREVDCPVYHLQGEISRVRGKIQIGEHDGNRLLVVVAVNEVIAAIGSPYEFKGEWLFDLLIPDTVYISDENSSEVFVVTRD